MPFGKFKSYEVNELPREYLTWLFANIDLREPLLSAVEEALDRDTEPPARKKDVPDDVRSVAHTLIAAGYRSLAQRYHPDHGGTHTDMLRLNEARRWLKEQAV
jgi:hypothetical protein